MTEPNPPAATDRTLEFTVPIAAPPDVVWAALTDPRGIESWFAYEARVTPGVGGSLYLGWGDFGGEATLTAWDPPRHARWTEHRPPYGDQSMPPGEVHVEYFVEGAGDQSIVRVVQYGMGPEAAWDGEYHATREDWPMFLAMLVHYATEHAGTPRVVTNFEQVLPAAPDAAWTRLFGPGDLFGEIEPGGTFERRLGRGDTLRGRVLLAQAGRRLVLSLDGLSNAIAVFTVRPRGEASKVTIELSTYGLGDDLLTATRDRWRAELEAMSA